MYVYTHAHIHHVHVNYRYTNISSTHALLLFYELQVGILLKMSIFSWLFYVYTMFSHCISVLSPCYWSFLSRYYSRYLLKPQSDNNFGTTHLIWAICVDHSRMWKRLFDCKSTKGWKWNGLIILMLPFFMMCNFEGFVANIFNFSWWWEHIDKNVENVIPS